MGAFDDLVPQSTGKVGAFDDLIPAKQEQQTYPDNSTGHLAEATAELGKSFMAAPNRTVATTPYGTGEAAAQLVTGLGSAAVGGFRGLYTGAKSLLAGKDTDAATQADTDAIQRTMQAGTYQPRTPSGKYLSANLVAPFEAAKEATQYGGGVIGGALQGVGTAIGTGAGALSTGKTFQQAFDEAIAAGAEAQMRGKGRLAGESIGNIVPDVVGTILGGRAIMEQAPNVPIPKAQDFIDSYKENKLAKQEAAAIASRNALPSSETAQLAVDEGYKLNPAKTNPTIGNRTLENVIGDSRLHNAAFKVNQERANLGARNQLGVGNGVGLDSALFDKVKEKATEPYREIEKIPEIPTDETFLNNIQGGSWIKSLPAEQQALFKNSPAINDMIETASLPSYTGLAAIKYITKLRNEANTTFRSASATDESTALANTKWSIARELESNIGRQLEKMDAANPNKGYGDLANRLKEGRQKYAEASTIENATTNGNVDVLKLAKDKRGDSFTGELDLMKRLGESHPEVFKKHGTTIPEIIKRYGIGGIGGGLVGAAVGGGPGFYAGTLIGGGLDPILSSLIKRRMLSESFQNKNVVPFDARPIREQLGYGQVEEQPTQTVPAKPVYSDAQYAADFAEYKPYQQVKKYGQAKQEDR